MLMFYLSMFESDDDKQTFENLYLKYRKIAFRAAMRVSNNHAMAEDAVHNGFLKIIADWDSFLKISCDKRASRIVIIVKNKMIDLLRGEKNYTFYNENEDYHVASDIDIEMIIENKEDSEFLKGCVAKLPEIYKTTLELKFYHEMSPSEIGKELGITPHNSTVRCSRGISLLSKIIKEGTQSE